MITFWHPSTVWNSTKAKPRERPVLRSYLTCAWLTGPNVEKNDSRSSWVVSAEIPPTNIFLQLKIVNF